MYNLVNKTFENLWVYLYRICKFVNKLTRMCNLCKHVNILFATKHVSAHFHTTLVTLQLSQRILRSKDLRPWLWHSPTIFYSKLPSLHRLVIIMNLFSGWIYLQSVCYCSSKLFVFLHFIFISNVSTKFSLSHF